MFYSEKNRFRLLWLINFFNRHQTKVQTVEKALAATAVVYAGHLKSAAGSYPVAFPQLVTAEKSGNNYSQELTRFNRETVRKLVTAEKSGNNYSQELTRFNRETVRKVFYWET